MRAKDFVTNADTFRKIMDAEVLGKDVAAQNKERNEDLADRKITAYSNLIADLKDIRLQKGNLPGSVRDKVWEGLTVSAGLSTSVAKKYMETSIKAIRMFDFPSQGGAAAVKQELLSQGLDSESKLRKRVSGEDKLTPEQQVAKDFVGGWTYKKNDEGESEPSMWKWGKNVDPADPFAAMDRAIEAMQEMRRIAEAALDAAREAESERATYEQVMAALGE